MSKTSSPAYFRRIRMFCGLPIYLVASATGISASRLQAIENCRREPNPTERRLLEGFLRDKLACVLAIDGPPPDWLRQRPALLTEGCDD
jgi:transcriptional regulator with XRE-family HTH domain